jgi:hypothetical protein
MSKIKTALFVLLLMQVGLTQAIELKEVVAHVIENNPEIKKIHYELESEIQDLFSSQKFPNTSLDLYGGAGGQRNFDYTSINIKDMDKYNAGIKLSTNSLTVITPTLKSRGTGLLIKLRNLCSHQQNKISP